ncbi:MAG: shikimate kinase [Lachnospiraceae bacterium]|nr:shikimate kinase [Lachnospiraceae bacterium]
MQTPISSKTNLILCGFMSSGKTTIGKPLANCLGYEFIDTDQLLTATYQMTIQEMFAKGGEAYFRDLEHEIARKAAAMTHTVISTGGGMMTFERNAAVLARTGIVIYIQQDFDTCYRRLASQPNRPLVRNNTREDLHRLYLSREAYYKKYASLTLTNPGSVKEAIQTIIDFL